MNDLVLSDVVTDENVFVVFSKDGKKQIVLAQNEDDLPVNLAEVSFAASLAEMKVFVDEMEKVKSLGVDESESGIVLRTNTEGDQK